MAAASRVVFVGSERDPCLLVEECDLPLLNDGDILAKIRLATICGSDLHTIAGKRKEATPSVLGHEAVAEVVESKGHPANVKPGDRITFSVADSCGRCVRCSAELPQKCTHLSKYGHSPLSKDSGFNGCYASHIVLKKGTPVFPIPDSVSDRLAAPINCALATMVNALSNIPADGNYKTAVIQGAGLLGLYGCALLSERGFSKVFCTDINAERLQLVPCFGGIACNSAYPKTNTEVPHKNSVDAVIEVCGAPSVVADGIQWLRPGGIYIFVGMVHPDSHLNLTAELLIRKCLTLKGIHNYAGCHLKEAVEFITQTAAKYPYDRLVSHEYTLRDLPEAVKFAFTQKYYRVAVRP